MVKKVTLVTHIIVYRKSTSVPRSPAPKEVRILTWMQDVIELRLNGWKKRREDVVSKTIDEIHKQLEKKQIEKKRREGKKRSEEKEDKRILELEEFNKHAQSTEIRLYDAELKVKFLEKENSRLKKQEEFYINKAREWKNRALKYERTLEDKGISVLTREKGKNQVNSIVHQFKCWPSFLGG